METGLRWVNCDIWDPSGEAPRRGKPKLKACIGPRIFGMLRKQLAGCACQDRRCGVIRPSLRPSVQSQLHLSSEAFCTSTDAEPDRVWNITEGPRARGATCMRGGVSACKHRRSPCTQNHGHLFPWKNYGPMVSKSSFQQTLIT